MLHTLAKQGHCAIIATIALKSLKEADIEAKLLYILIKEDAAHCVVCFQMDDNHVGIYDSNGTGIVKMRNWQSEPIRLGKYWAKSEDNTFLSAKWLEDIEEKA